MYGGTSPSGGEKPFLVPLELAGKPLIRIANCKLGWVCGASTDVRAWVMSCPTPVSVSRSSPGPAKSPSNYAVITDLMYISAGWWYTHRGLMELKLVTKATWKRELDFSSGLVTGWPEGHVGDWWRLLWAVGRLGVVPEQALDLRRSRIRVPSGTCRVLG